ncbi:hypothetical protein AYO43_07565 [Nitrospira sp. SCGC AG-212-E16]|nr:hypothetical protein AYO43_07565 [Nitrospira sp. SCGC AG-212-E16]
MAAKKILDDLQNAVSIAQAGIKATLKSLIKAQSKAKKLTARKRAPKKQVAKKGMTTPSARPKQKLPGRNPSKLVIRARAAVPRTPNKQNPAKKSP